MGRILSAQRLIRAGRRFARSSWRRRGRFLVAITSLVVADLALRTIPLRFLVSNAAPAHQHKPQPAHANKLRWARSVGRDVAIASRYLPHHPRCLAQGLAVQWLLSTRHIASTLSLGVSTTPSGNQATSDSKMAAHAWVSVDEQIVVGANGYEQFTEVAAFAR